MDGLALRGFYAMVDVKSSAEAQPDALLRRAQALLAAAPCCLQLRGKRLSASELRDAAVTLLPACRAAGVPFCVNDRVDVALLVGADVIHVGQDDLPLAEVRRLVAGVPRRMWIGVSTHDRSQAQAAAGGGADYIGFGPVFGTSSKERPDPVVGLEGLTEVARLVSIPVVAIGGITLERARAVAETGAAAAAVIGAVEAAADATEAGRAIAAAFRNGGRI